MISPTHINENSNNLLDSFIGTKQTSISLASLYNEIAQELGTLFLDASKVVTTNEIDGLHWDKYQHNEFGLLIIHYICRNIIIYQLTQ